ncbi:TPA: restriction endonuclease subunit S [Aeromonas veronii]|nr:restriction endonuclease subunit S [Aeromonas veronii]
MSNWYPAYSEYNNSDVAWIEKYPSHWECSKVKYYLEKLIAGGTPESGNADYWIDSGEGTPWVSIADITLNPDVSTTKKDVTDAGIKAKNLKILPKGTVLYSIFASLGKVGEAKVRLTTNQAILGLVPTKKLNKELFKYWLHSVEAHLGLLSSSNTQDNLNAEKVGNLPILLPPAEEQQTIAAFLDYETARIDRLIAQQQRLIELLKEKRQAVISHAVTKGLNPDATMKDSGIEWLGQVPEHWIVKPLRHLGYCQNGINIGAEAFGSGYPFVSYGDAYKNRVLPETGSGLVQSTPEDRKRYSLLAGDVLFTRTSETIEEIGFASTCLKTIENACFAGFLIRFRPNPNDLDANYSKYYFSNQLLRAFFIKEMNLITRASLSQDLLKAMPVVLPPRTEQKAIAEVLDEKSKRFDRLQQLGDEQIKILQERRTALISAAVTGKIDLRGWTPPADEVAA